MIQLIDGMNYYRRRLELANFGQSIPRVLFYETFLPMARKIWVWDGPYARETRQKIYPRYKTNRQPLAEPIARGIDFFKELMCHSAATQVMVPGYEADDVIAELVRRFKANSIPVEIHSRDYDFAALGVPVIGATEKPIAPGEVHLFKTLVGDPSDSVTGVRGFGPGAWNEMSAEVRADLMRALEARDHQRLVAAPWPKARGVARWVEENPDEVQACWDVTAFLPVPEPELNDGIRTGRACPEAGESMLKEFFL